MIVEYNSQLLEYLLENTKDKSKNNIKSLLKNGQVLVNNKVITQYNYNLKKGQKISFNYNVDRGKSLNIIYEDKNIIVIDKPHGLLTIADAKEKENTAYHTVREYLNKKKKNSKVFVIHRIDKDTSGIVMFAKNEETKRLYQDSWEDIVKLREYIAIVSGTLDQKEGTIQTYLTENATGLVYSTKKGGKLAITKYKVLKENKKYSMLQVDIETGRKNQIRVHMKEIGHPIIGDKKYGAPSSPINRLALHASCLKIINPITKEVMTFKSKPQNKFENLFKN